MRKADIEFLIDAIYPHPLEDGSDFLRRVQSYLLCEAPFKRWRQRSLSPPTSLDDLEVVDEISSEALHVLVLGHCLLPGSRAGTERNTGIDVARLVRHYRPNVQRLLLSAESDTGWPQAPEVTVEAFFSKHRLLSETEQVRLRQTIYNRLDERLSAPHWSGLQKYSAMPKIVMHAMAITDAGSLSEAGTAREFLRHFGRDMFLAEASLTLAPLDSVFSPHGSLKRSLELYAKTFAGEGIGAKCLFSTNGTSTSNKIVTEAVTNQGDIVLIDRNCHISHHYAYVNQGLCPVWLQPDHDPAIDVSAAVTPDVLRQALDRLLEAGKARGEIKLPSLITITNCSFDGFVVDPVAIVKTVIDSYKRFGVLGRLVETAFLFDEAWFGFARFHPATAMFSAAQAMRHFQSDTQFGARVRIYATTSVHKTMSALRQASTILIADPLFHGDRAPLATRFAQAYSNHTTTSPHTAMISSIDIARRQIDVEGTALLDKAIRSARWLRTELGAAEAKEEPVAGFFRIAKFSAGLDQLKRDPTKLLVQVPRSIGGAKMKQLLWEKARIQVNKFSRNTVLFMFMIGFDGDRAERLLDAMRKMARTLIEEGFSSDGFDAKSASPALPSFAAFLGTGGLSSGLSVEQAYLAGNLFDGRSVMRGDAAKHVEYVGLETLRQQPSSFIAAGFVTPYPPGYPILVPGQVIDAETSAYLQALDNPEIHGTIKEGGLIALPVVKVE